MRKLQIVVTAAIALSTVAAWNAPVRADADDNPRPPVHVGHERESILDRLTRELRLTEDQREQVRAILADTDRKVDAVRDNTRIDQDDKAPHIRAIYRAAFNKIKTVLTPQQRERLQDIWTAQGERDELARLTRQLNLNEEQREQVRRILASEGRQIDAAQDSGSLDRDDRNQMISDIRQATWDKIRRVLSPEQRDTLADASSSGRVSGRQLAELNRVVHLNEEQREQVRSLYASGDRQIDRIKENQSLSPEDSAEQIKAVNRSTWQKIERFLTPQQRKLWRNRNSHRDSDGDRS